MINTIKRLTAILTLAALITLPSVQAQADMLTSVALTYKEQQQTLRKMWQARKDGDSTEVKRLSGRLNNFIERQKRLARVNIEVAEAVLKKRDETAPTLDQDQRKQLERLRTSILAQIKEEQDLIEIFRGVFIRENGVDRKDIAWWEKNLANIDQGYAEHMTRWKKDIKASEMSLATTQKAIKEEIAKRKKEITRNKGEYKQALQKNLNEVMAGIAAGSYTPTHGGDGIKKIKEWIKAQEDARDELVAAYSAGLWNPHPSGYNAKKSRGAIAHHKKVLAERRLAYTSGAYHNLKVHLARLRQLRMELIGLRIKLGDPDNQRQVLESQIRELKVFLEHKFDTALPKEDSAWVKAINWCAKAYNNVQEIRNKIGKFKVLFDVLQGGNPVKAADVLLEMSTGKGIADTLMKYPPFNKLLKFGALKDAIVSGKIDRKTLIRQVAEKNIDKGVIETYDLLNRFKNDPKAFLKDKASKQVEAILKANPRVKSAIDGYAKAQEYLKNPQLLEERLKARMTKDVLKEARKLESFRAIETAMDEGRQSIEKLEAQVNARAEKLKGDALKAVMESEPVRAARAQIDELNQAGRHMENRLKDKLKNVEKEFIRNGAGKTLKEMQDGFKATEARLKRILDPDKTPRDLYEANLNRSVIKNYDETNQYRMGVSNSASRGVDKIMMDDFSFQD